VLATTRDPDLARRRLSRLGLGLGGHHGTRDNDANADGDADAQLRCGRCQDRPGHGPLAEVIGVSIRRNYQRAANVVAACQDMRIAVI
jgi:hypothetical protein